MRSTIRVRRQLLLLWDVFFFIQGLLLHSPELIIPLNSYILDVLIFLVELNARLVYELGTVIVHLGAITWQTGALGALRS
jgi:hypothetical protein